MNHPPEYLFSAAEMNRDWATGPLALLLRLNRFASVYGMNAEKFARFLSNPKNNQRFYPNATRN